MTCGFVWKVKGTYIQPEDDVESFYGPVPVLDFECLVITHDPHAGDVATLALKMRIGEQECWEQYNAQVTSMKLMGWAQGDKNE